MTRTLLPAALVVLLALFSHALSHEGEAHSSAEPATERADTTGAAEPVAAPAEADSMNGPSALARAREAVGDLFRGRCSACHSESRPADGLVLTLERYEETTVGVPSSQLEGAVLVSPGEPDVSYLLMKVRGDERIAGSRMPMNAPPLGPDELARIEKWVNALPVSDDPTDRRGQDERDEEEYGGERVMGPRHFPATRLVNLPTTEVVDDGDVLFTVSHRFVPSLTSGYDPDFFGLNGPANIRLSLSYGLTERLSVALAHDNLFHEYELSARWRILEQRHGSAPVSATILAGGSLVTQNSEEHDVFSSDNMKFNAQLALSRRVNRRVSVLLVPSYSTNTNHWEDDSESTLALGTGGTIRIAGGLSATGEWVPVLDGYHADYDGWSAGLAYEVGGHVFQVFVTNTTGITTDQYLPGGYPELGSEDPRLGFNIFRTFWN